MHGASDFRSATAHAHGIMSRMVNEERGESSQRRRASLPLSCGLTQFSHRERVNTILRDGCRFLVRDKAEALDKAGALALELGLGYLREGEGVEACGRVDACPLSLQRFFHSCMWKKAPCRHRPPSALSSAASRSRVTRTRRCSAADYAVSHPSAWRAHAELGASSCRSLASRGKLAPRPRRCAHQARQVIRRWARRLQRAHVGRAAGTLAEPDGTAEHIDILDRR